MTEISEIVRRKNARFFLLIALAVAPYLNSLPNEFTLDDGPIIVNNPLVHSLKQTPRIFSSGYWPEADADKLYRPLVIWSYALNFALVGNHPAGFRVFNIALYAVCVLLVFRLIQRLFDDQRLALATAVLFAVHPIHVEAVASIVGRAELMMSAFVLLSLLCYLKVATATTPGRYAKNLGASLVCFFLALLCKEKAVALVALVPLVDATRSLREGDVRRVLRQNARFYVVFAAVAALYFCIRVVVLGAVTSAQVGSPQTGSYALLAGAPFATRWVTPLRALGGYWKLLIWPSGLSAFHDVRMEPGFMSFDVVWPLVVAMAVCAWVIWSARKRHAEVFFSIGFFALTFLPVSNFTVPIGTVLAERLIFLASLGFSLLVGQFLSQTRKPVLIVLLGLLAIFGGLRIGSRNTDWKNNIAIGEAALQVDPHSAHAIDNLAVAYLVEGDDKRAEDLLLQAVKITPLNWSPYLNLGNLYAMRGQSDQADRWYAKAAELNPENPKPHFNRGLLAAQKGKFDEAISLYRRALELDPHMAVAHNALGAALARQKKFSEAEAAFRRALELDPANQEAQQNLETLKKVRRQPVR